MYKFIVQLIVVLTAVTASAAEQAGTEDQKTLRAIGISVARSLRVFDLSPAELQIVQQAIADDFNGKSPDADIASSRSTIQEFASARRKALGEKQAAAGREFLEQAARKKGAVRTGSGVVFTPLSEGKGESPKASDVVKVHYRGTLPDGKEFDSSYLRGRPLEFRLDNVIKCWVEGIQKMKPGGRAKLVCPPNLAYGDSGAGEQILPGATLAFDIELLEVSSGALPLPGNSSSAKTPTAK
jgi:FKBP-type peptidyl-prolyl cis-trans isomerase FkpA